jgi:hypothetical protein
VGQFESAAKWHDFSRVEPAAKGHDFSRVESAAKGHDFSRAVKRSKSFRALAPEGRKFEPADYLLVSVKTFIALAGLTLNPQDEPAALGEHPALLHAG